MLSKSTNTAILRRSSTNDLRPPKKKHSDKEAQKSQKVLYAFQLARFGSLFLEEVVESAAGVCGLNRRCLPGSTSRVPGFSLDGGTSHEKLALISQILLRDPLGNVLRALEPGRRIEMAAVFA